MFIETKERAALEKKRKTKEKAQKSYEGEDAIKERERERVHTVEGMGERRENGVRLVERG